MGWFNLINCLKGKRDSLTLLSVREMGHGLSGVKNKNPLRRIYSYLWPTARSIRPLCAIHSHLQLLRIRTISYSRYRTAHALRLKRL